MMTVTTNANKSGNKNTTNIHTHNNTDYANDKKRAPVACFRTHKIERQRRNKKDRAADQADQGEQLLASGSFIHEIYPLLFVLFMM